MNVNYVKSLWDPSFSNKVVLRQNLAEACSS